MAPSAVSEPAPTASVAVTKSQPAEKVEKEVTPLEAISHGDVLPGRWKPLDSQQRQLRGLKVTKTRQTSPPSQATQQSGNTYLFTWPPSSEIGLEWATPRDSQGISLSETLNSPKSCG